MLQIWRKSSHKQRRSGSGSSSSSPPATPSSPEPSVSGLAAVPLVSLDDEGLFDLSETDIPKQQSRLSKTLKDVLDDKSALEYFVQYLELRKSTAYLRCLLDIQAFEASVLKASEACGSSSAATEHDSLSVSSTDCDSCTADLSDFSLAENSTHCDRDDTSHKLDVVNGTNSGEANETTPSPVRKKCRLQILTNSALDVFKKYLSLEADESVKCPEDLRNEVIENICDSGGRGGVLDHRCFEKVERFVRDTLEKDFFPAFLASDFFCKHQIDVLTGGNVALEDILFNETALFYFMEFLEQENQRGLLEFWIAASNFQLHLEQQRELVDQAEAQGDAVVLYDKYFSLQALCPLGFGDKIRLAVEQNICGETGIVPDCFHLPLKIVEQVLERNYLKTFVGSQLFYKYLSELIHAVHNSAQDALSECSSEKSFLAMQVPKSASLRSRKEGADMHIDTRQLYDPDSLWKRKRYHRLSLGRVNSLGKYEAEFEPEPDKKSAFRLKRMVRKFVHLEEDKHKEEMAWQVAEMIVKDITNITMSDVKGFQS